MKSCVIRSFYLVALCAFPVAASHLAHANGPLHGAHCAECQQCPNCQWVEEIVMQDCVTHRCKMVPHKKEVKKTVYECKEVPFCLHKLSHHHHDCGCCPECESCPRYKTVLLKKEVVDHVVCGTKCEVEEVVTKVPVKVRRCIPCGSHGACNLAPITAPYGPPTSAPTFDLPPAPVPAP
jgi:hypothetical protein